MWRHWKKTVRLWRHWKETVRLWRHWKETVRMWRHWDARPRLWRHRKTTAGGQLLVDVHFGTFATSGHKTFPDCSIRWFSRSFNDTNVMACMSLSFLIVKATVPVVCDYFDPCVIQWGAFYLLIANFFAT